ncbi:MAG TPA: peptidoglycan-associated lipoprotein Pal [Candidatus Binatia bacterium]|jgi:peptidoglycan-associated lipoprotein
MTRERKPLLSYGLSLLTVTFLISCGGTANPPPPKWTAENPSAPTTATGTAKPPAPAKPDPGTTSSLDSLRTGESPTGGPLKDVNFDFDSAALSEPARATLKAHADWLKTNAAARVQIEGHCDERGTAEYNMALGAKRAQAAMDYLTTLGIAGNRLSTISYGEEIPACKEKTEECWARNRRARFVVSQTKPTS